MVTIERYDRFSPIGSGGFSQVYKAWQPDFNRWVAIKVLTIGVADEVDRRAFERECIAMGSVSEHPNIVTVYDSGFTKEGLPYLAMELYTETLLSRIKSRSFVPVEEVLELAVLLAGALQRAHSERILHRDIKPQNVFYSAYDVPALADFGIASLASDTRQEQTTGLTIHYAAPEILDGASPTVESDIYSLGATLFTALAGHRPFARPGQKDSEAALTNRILTEPPPAITAQTLPPRADRAMRTLLAKHPNDRPRTALDVANLFRDIQQRMGISPTALRIADSQLDQEITVSRRPVRQTESSPSADSRSPLDDGNTTGSVTMARSKVGYKPTEEFREPDRSNRKLIGLVALGAALVIGAGGAHFALQSPDRETTTTSTTSTSQTPQTLPAPAPGKPTGVTIAAGNSPKLISWDEVEGADRYQVNFLGATPRTEAVAEAQFTTAADEVDFCITVEAIGPTNKLSIASEVVCNS